MNNYVIDELGIIHQVDKKPFVYDEQYVNGYNKFKSLTDQMGHLRLGFLTAGIGHKPSSVIDFGYGNGAFLEAAKDYGIQSYGSDLSGYDIPKGCTFIPLGDIDKNEYEVFCFFDSLEHTDDMSFIKNLKTKYIFISVPWCHYKDLGEDWFMNWKHRKPNEHLHHFDKQSLENFFNANGYDLMSYSNIEDCIRKPVDDNPNILSAIFKKRG